jgi:hypothetical protein
MQYIYINQYLYTYILIFRFRLYYLKSLQSFKNKPIFKQCLWVEKDVLPRIVIQGLPAM